MSTSTFVASRRQNRWRENSLAIADEDLWEGSIGISSGVFSPTWPGIRPPPG